MRTDRSHQAFLGLVRVPGDEHAIAGARRVGRPRLDRAVPLCARVLHVSRYLSVGFVAEHALEPGESALLIDPCHGAGGESHHPLPDLVHSIATPGLDVDDHLVWHLRTRFIGAVDAGELVPPTSIGGLDDIPHSIDRAKLVGEHGHVSGGDIESE